MQGTLSKKIGNSWRLAERLELVEDWLRAHRAVNFKHICREGNKVADLLANIGVESNTTLKANQLSSIKTDAQMKEFNEIVEKEKTQEGAPSHSNCRDTGKNAMDESLFTSHGLFGGIQHGEGGSSAATRPSGGSSFERPTMQVAMAMVIGD